MTTQDLYKVYLRHPAIQTDTRKLQPGDLFFALKGPNFDGNTYALQALEQGAAYAVIDNASCAGDDRCILVDDVLTTGATLESCALALQDAHIASLRMVTIATGEL